MVQRCAAIHQSLSILITRTLLLLWLYCTTCAFTFTVVPVVVTANSNHNNKKMFSNFKKTPGAARVGSVCSNDQLDDWTDEDSSNQDQKEARMVNAIFSAAVVLQDASVTNGILNGTLLFIIYVYIIAHTP